VDGPVYLRAGGRETCGQANTFTRGRVSGRTVEQANGLSDGRDDVWACSVGD
jgi:hypothetical protein